VLPGLVDLHCHVYPYGSAIGIPADELVQFEGTTTVVSAGDAGANNLAALRRYIVAQSRARIYAFVHIANNGLSAFPVAELYNIDNAQVEACAMALAENPAPVAETPAPVAGAAPAPDPRARAVCHCKAVSVGMIADAVALGHTTREAVARATRASTGCGGCGPWVDKAIREALPSASAAA